MSESQPMFKVILLMTLTVTLSLVYAQKTKKNTNTKDNQAVAANTINSVKGDAINSTDLTQAKKPQAGKAKGKVLPKVPPKRKRKRKRKRRIRTRFRGRRPRRRKRPQRRQRRPKPTRKAPGQRKQNLRKPKVKSNGQQGMQVKSKKQEQPAETNAKQLKTKPISVVNAKAENQMKVVKVATLPQKEIHPEPNQENNKAQKISIPFIKVKKEMQPSQQTVNEKDLRPQTNIDTLENHSLQENRQKLQNKPKLFDKPKRENKPKPQLPKPKRKAKKENNFNDPNDFFDFFMITTTKDNILQPPPDFDPIKKPGKKVLPKVDPSKGIAHDGTPCAVNYKAHPDDKTRYMMRLPDDQWQAADCPPNLSLGLVWRQDLCNCGEELVPQDPNDICGLQGYNVYPDNPHKYMRRHHGINNVMACPADLVWSQKECLCHYDPDAIRPIEPTVTFVCKTILNLTFENNLKNSAEGYYVKPVKFGRRNKIPRIRFIKTPGADGLAAQIVSQPLQFQAFRGNDFQRQVTFSLNFKISGRRTRSKNFMLLLTDECERKQSGQNKQWKPSISLSFQPSSRTFRLLFRTEKKLIEEEIKGAKPDNSGWYRVVVYFEDQTVNLENNGQKLFTATDVQGKIPPNRCPLYIAGRGRGYNKVQNFYGFMDNIFLVKDCKFHESNIKIL